MSELEALITLQEGAEVLDADAMMVDVDPFELEQCVSDALTDFKDAVVESVFLVSASESELERA